jgi:Domain of unknown function (DUF4185)
MTSPSFRTLERSASEGRRAVARTVFIATAFLAAGLLSFASSAARAEKGIAPPPPIRVGASEKICQLTGDVDWESGAPTAARTFAEFGLDATDLGYPVEHDGKLIFLFGDSWPPPHGGGLDGETIPDDAVGVTLRRKPPGDDGQCLDLQIHVRRSAPKAFAPATVLAPMQIKQGFFNVPSGGVSANGGLFGFFWTDHCFNPNPLGPHADAPLARPNPSLKCPETDDRNSIGRNVVARSDDDGASFYGAVPMPTGFAYAAAVNSLLPIGLPDAQRQGVFVFGVPRYRASAPYLAVAPVNGLSDPVSWRYFVGRDENGEPQWTSLDKWSRGATGDPRPAAWRPPGQAEIFAPVADGERCIGEFSITWNPPLREWLALYNCQDAIRARVATAPWGPWSAPTTILGPADDLGCRLLMKAEGCGARRDYWPSQHIAGKFMPGGPYAPYVLNRYTTAADAAGLGRVSTIYWIVSTWNPYEVTVMLTTLREDSR